MNQKIDRKAFEEYDKELREKEETLNKDKNEYRISNQIKNKK